METKLQLTLPPVVAALLRTLQAAGHQAFVVGGCVRDSLLGRAPEDWDICTSAQPGEVEALFQGRRLLLNGKKHGTVAVVEGGKSWEITTFRRDGAYSDGRHPDAVRFVPDVRQDLARRDFTVNAMAWSPAAGLVDPFGGRADLRAGVLRCVGDPNARFAEDALRVLRAPRFCAGTGHGRGRAALPRRRCAGIAGAHFYRAGQAAGRGAGRACAGAVRGDPGRGAAGNLTLHRLHTAEPLALL